jgi:hypothetical protein
VRDNNGRVSVYIAVFVAIVTVIAALIPSRYRLEPGHRETRDSSVLPSSVPPPPPVKSIVPPTQDNYWNAGDLYWNAGDLQSIENPSHQASKPRLRSPSRSPASTDPVEDEYENEVKNAKSGEIKYHVPSDMVVAEVQTVTVRIYGPAASQAQKQDFSATGSGSLKVVSPMLVTLSEPDNPDAFKIVQDDREWGLQFLPSNSFAEWMWTVTPLKSSSDPDKLRISAFMVFQQKLPNGMPAQAEIGSYTATVKVKVEPRMKVVGEWLSENWKDVLKYLIPGGAGTAFIAWLVSRSSGKRAGKEEEKKDDEDDDSGEDENV